MAVELSTTPSKEGMAASSPAIRNPSASPQKEIREVASKFAGEPVNNPDPSVWAVLTAISANARRRCQGMNIKLSEDEHCFGRCVDASFQIVANAVSAKHCKIFREKVLAADCEMDSDPVQVFLKDTSTNGTYLNWDRLMKKSPKARLQHGDIISFVAPPHNGSSYAFVYREVSKSIDLAKGSATKRKPEQLGVESKRLKGIGIGAPEGPISLDDVRSLQRSNTELRQQLESQVLTIETLRGEIRESIASHENELKVLKKTISDPYLHQIKDLQYTLNVKQKELEELNTSSTELRSSIKDLNERLGASMQSRVDADEIIVSQKATISDLEAQLDEERNQRVGEREKAEADLKSALQRAHSEAQAEIKRQADVYSKQHREQQEVISKLQETERESRSLVETLRSKLEDARESIVISEKKVRQLEVQVQDEHVVSANSRKKSEGLETELQRLKKELENMKVAREEAWAKVSVLELDMSAKIRELSMEKQRFQGARERIILRETQLRSFYSTTEEISALFTKQQEQLKAMQKTLEDEENYESTLFGIDLNEPEADEVGKRTGEAPGCSNLKNVNAVDISSGGDDVDTSATEKHDCDLRSQDVNNTQDLDCTSADRSGKGFDLAVPLDTERVLGTESPVAGETLQLDVETQELNNLEATENLETRMDDTLRTADLLASEVAGSWAGSTAPSVHGENETPMSIADVAAAAAAAGSQGEDDPDVAAAAGSQSNAVSGLTRMTEEHLALNAMIGIVAPDFRQQFQGCGVEEKDSMSSAETEEGSGSDNEEDEDEAADVNSDVVGDGNEAMIEDSVG